MADPGVTSDEPCAICLIAEPRFSSCGHPFCESCMHSYVLGKLAEQQDRYGHTDEGNIPCPLCQQALLPEEIEAAIGEGLEGEHSLSKFLLEEAKKMPNYTVAEASRWRCWCHVSLLLLIAVIYAHALSSDNLLLLIATTAVAVPYMWIRPMVTSRELRNWVDGVHECTYHLAS